MAKYGFVYLLGNIYMHDLYKIGCTERSPAQRAEEISKATGVPHPYDVICYWEGERFQEYERVLHEAFNECRVNDNREFFHHPLLYELVEDMQRRWIDDQCAFTITRIGEWYLEQDKKRGPR